MLNILIIDDSPEKVSAIRELLEPKSFIRRIECANDIVNARVLLEHNYFDLVIIDLNIPQRFGDMPSPENCLGLINELSNSQRLTKPNFIIGLTIHDNLISKYELEFKNKLWHLILFNQNSDSWTEQLNTKIEYLDKLKKNAILSVNEFEADLAIVTALHYPELKALLNIDLDWREYKFPNDSTEYHIGKISNGEHSFSVVAVTAPQMGMTAASALTTKVIYSFRPKYVLMCGIAAGVEGVTELGDILIAESSFDYTSGKMTIKEGGKTFEPDFKPIDIDIELLEIAQSCKRERTFLDQIQDKWPSNSNLKNSRLNVHIGPFASGGSVVADENQMSAIKQHSRKLIGIDMETYGVYYACRVATKPKPRGVISIKSVVDFANGSKNDSVHDYASFVSAWYGIEFMKHKILPRINEK